jgi:hypothetical protein
MRDTLPNHYHAQNIKLPCTPLIFIDQCVQADPKQAGSVDYERFITLLSA